jgi:hypothetical protein
VVEGIPLALIVLFAAGMSAAFDLAAPLCRPLDDQISAEVGVKSLHLK